MSVEESQPKSIWADDNEDTAHEETVAAPAPSHSREVDSNAETKPEPIANEIQPNSGAPSTTILNLESQTQIWQQQAKLNKERSEMLKKAKKAGGPIPENLLKRKGDAENLDLQITKAPKTTHTVLDVSQLDANSLAYRQKQTARLALKVIPARDFTYGCMRRLPTKIRMERVNGKPKRFPYMQEYENVNGGPVIMRFSGGGTIPQTFGVKLDNFKVPTICLTIEDPDEIAACDRLHDDKTHDIVRDFNSYFPDKKMPEDISKLCNRLLSGGQRQQGSEYSPSLSAKLRLQDLLSSDKRKPPLIQVFNQSTNKYVSPQNLGSLCGMRWTEFDLEFEKDNFTYAVPDPLYSKNKAKQQIIDALANGKDEEDIPPPTPIPSVTFIKRLRGTLYVIDDDRAYHLPFLEESAQHDASDCRKKHHVPISICDISFRNHVLLLALRSYEQSHTARMVAVNGGGVYIKYTGGGSLPAMFYWELGTLNNKVSVTFSIEDPTEEKKSDEFSDEMRAVVIERRGEFFPNDIGSEEMLTRFIKKLLPKRNPAAEASGYARNMNCPIELNEYGRGVRFYEADGTFVTEPEKLGGRKWEEIWVHVKSLYQQKKAEAWEVGFSKRITYMRLKPASSDYREIQATDGEEFAD